jgi:uncharacterized membrane protein YbaN (DUF454 family)
MTREQAKAVLLGYRPGQPGEPDAEMRTALTLAHTDTELASWLAEHLRFQAAVQTRLRSLPVPAGLKDRLLSERKVVRHVNWRTSQTTWLAAAACVALLAVAAFWLRAPAPNGFENFQSRMVSTALRQYRMDVETNDMATVRGLMASRGAPADYEVTPGLQKLTLTGGGVLTWRSRPVAMVCFNRGDDQMLYLFVTEQRAMPNPPGERPEVGRVRDLVTVSWSRGGKIYVLAGPEEGDFSRKYL